MRSAKSDGINEDVFNLLYSIKGFSRVLDLWCCWCIDFLHVFCIYNIRIHNYTYMAAAQNVRSGSSPGPTHDPDLRSRPPIQTFRKDLIQTFDPDLWNDIMYWWVDVWSSDGCMFLGFLLCSYSPCQAAKQQTVVKPRCQAVKLLSCTCRQATLLSSQAVQQPSCNCCASKLSNCKADTVASCKASLPSSQAVHLLPAHLVVLFLSCCIQAATYTNMWVHFWADPDPDPDRSRPDPDHNQLRSRPQPALC